MTFNSKRTLVEGRGRATHGSSCQLPEEEENENHDVGKREQIFQAPVEGDRQADTHEECQAVPREMVSRPRDDLGLVFNLK